MFIHSAFARRPEPVAFDEGQFTSEEADRIGALRRQYLAYPDSFKLNVNYRHAHFIRWLVRNGRLGEGISASEDAHADSCEPLKCDDPGWT